MINERIAAGNQGKVFTFFRYLAELGMAGGLLIGGALVQALGSRGALVAMLVYLVVLDPSTASTFYTRRLWRSLSS